MALHLALLLHLVVKQMSFPVLFVSESLSKYNNSAHNAELSLHKGAWLKWQVFLILLNADYNCDIKDYTLFLL